MASNAATSAASAIVSTGKQSRMARTASWAGVRAGTTSAAADRSPEQWARAGVEYAVGLAGQFVWRVVLGLRLERRSSPDHVGGWKIVIAATVWTYVTAWLGLVEVGYIEPKPGTPPSADHTARLIATMRAEGVRLVIHEDFYPSSMASFVAEKGGGRAVACPSDVGARPAIKTYFDLGDAVIGALLGGLK